MHDAKIILFAEFQRSNHISETSLDDTCDSCASSRSSSTVFQQQKQERTSNSSLKIMAMSNPDTVLGAPFCTPKRLIVTKAYLAPRKDRVTIMRARVDDNNVARRLEFGMLRCW